MGHLPRRRRARPHASPSATTAASRCGRRCRASTGPTCAGCVVVQGDTEPASVEQQRHLCLTAPSLYDMRNLFQVNVEEGRHLWAMVYLLHRYFGRDGRDEADEMLERHSGDVDHPRILGAFNEPTPDWLSFFFFTYFTDRDGKFQLASLRESAFDPLSRTCEFMLKEEAHHMFVGATGVGRVVQRTVDLMKEHDTEDVRALSAASTSRRCSATSTSTTACRSTCSAPRRRRTPRTTSRRVSRDDSKRSVVTTTTSLRDATASVPAVVDGAVGEREVPALSALNETLRDDYTADCAKGIDRWNRTLARSVPSCGCRMSGFNRRVGAFAAASRQPRRAHRRRRHVGRELRLVAADRRRRAFVRSLMQPVIEPGKMAGWIAPPAAGINGKPVEFEYVERWVEDRERYNAAAWLVDRHVDVGRRRSSRRRLRDEQLTYGELLRQDLARPARALRRSASGAPNASCSCMDDEPAFLAWFLGALRSGVVPVPLSTMLTKASSSPSSTTPSLRSSCAVARATPTRSRRDRHASTATTGATSTTSREQPVAARPLRTRLRSGSTPRAPPACRRA